MRNKSLSIGILALSSASSILGQRLIPEPLRGFGYRTSNPTVNAKDFGARGDGTTDDTAAITSAMAGGKRVVFPSGTYVISSGLTLVAGQVIACNDPATTIQAKSGFSGTALFTIAVDSAAIEGCKVDANSNAATGVLISTGATHFRVDSSECTGSTGDCISISTTTLTGVQWGKISRNKVHDWGANGTGISLRGSSDVDVIGNEVYGTGGSASNQSCMAAGGALHLGWIDNTVTAACFSAITGYRNIEPRYLNNRITGAYNRNLECDTCYAPLFAHNVIDGVSSANGFSGIESEVGAYAIISNNTISHVAKGIFLFGRPSVDQVLLNSAEANWTCPANVTCTLDSSDKQVGSNSVQLVVGAGFAGGTIGYAATPASADATLYQFVRLWLKSSARILPGVLSIQLSSQAGLANNVVTEPLPGLYANDWQQIYVPLRVYWNATGMSGILSVGLVGNPGATTLHIDDVQLEAISMRNAVTGNIITGAGIAVDVSNLSSISHDSDIIGNVAHEVGQWTQGASGSTCIYSQNAAATHNRIISNTCRSTTTNVALGNQIGIDDRADSSIIERNHLLGFPANLAIYSTGTNTIQNANRQDDTGEVPETLFMRACTGLSGIVCDSFHRADSASAIGTAQAFTWTNSVGTWGISGGKAYLPAATNSIAQIDSGQASVSILMRLSTIGTQEWIVARFSDTSNFWRYGHISGVLTLQKVVAGSATTVYSGTGNPVGANDWLQLTISGNVFTCRINGTTACSVTDTFNNSATKHGIQAANTTARVAAFSIM